VPRTLRIAASVGALIALGAGAPVADAQVLLTQEEALSLAFPAPAMVERRTAYLDEDQVAEVAERARPTKVKNRAVVTYYVGVRDGEPLGAAYFDAHRVRTLQEVLMVVVNPSGRVSRIEILGFAEPPDYMAPDGWLDLFSGRGLEPQTSTRGDIPILTGATLTSHAVSDAVRLNLALHSVIQPFETMASAGPRP
jgi:Na+-translocating ferredoxin:NAD+ oxidoreductase RnfG subunit